MAEHPPLDCTEPDMYHCFCKAPDLQRYFVECAYSDCPLTAESVEAVGFGVDLCAGMSRLYALHLSANALLGLMTDRKQ